MMRHSKGHEDLYTFFKNIDRSYFIDNEYHNIADLDRPLPIGYEQTISQPSLVYQMTSLLELDKTSKVLEIGTGSGFQTVLLAEFAAAVYTVERIEVLASKAQERLLHLGYENIHFKVGDGSDGWAEFAPYDRIIATAAAGKLPGPLVQQLKPGGRMIIPVGEKGCQDLLLIQKDEDGTIKQEILEKVVFVEFKGSFGWDIPI